MCLRSVASLVLAYLGAFPAAFAATGQLVWGDGESTTAWLLVLFMVLAASNCRRAA